MADFLKLAKDAYESSTSFIDANWRSQWDYSIKTFNLEHAGNSKYLSEEYKSRSRLVSPKTRSIIRKTEAAAAVALFSNMEMVNIEPNNPDDPMSVASADAMKSIMEYRLQKTLPTYELVIGGVQDAQVQGAVVSYQYWEYETDSAGRVKKDKPCIELRPIENIRIDGGASWIDPINTSPYLCDIIPMYVCDVRAMMDNKDPKTGKPKWKKFKDEIIAKAKPDAFDSTKKARAGQGRDTEAKDQPIKSFDIVWVMRWFMKDSSGDDFTYYTLGTEELLTEPKPIKEVYFHGIRPYAMGYAVLETHKVMKTSAAQLVKPIQLESTDLRNQRLDNVKFVLNKRWIVARGRQVDVQSLVRNVPGGVTLTTDPNTDVKESNWPDVTSSAFVEHDRLNAEFDDLAGNFSPSTRVANNAINDTLGGSKLAMQSAGIMTDYMLRTIIETWWEPVLRQLAKLESYYETDETILAICADKAKLFPKYGLSRISDEMLAQEMTLTVNAGFGASDPNAQLQKFIAVTDKAMAIVANAPPGFNAAEAIKEMYSKAGYRDGTRFFSQQQDPRLAQAMQMVQQLQQQLQSKGMEMQANMQLEQQKLASNERIKGAEIQVNHMRIRGDLAVRQAELMIQQQELELEKLKAQIEIQGASEEQRLRVAELSSSVEQAQMKLEGERQKIAGQAMKLNAELEKSQLALATVRAENENEQRIGMVADQVTQSMGGIAQEIAAISEALSEAKENISEMSGMREKVDTLGAGLALMLQDGKPKRKPVGFKVKKSGGKTAALTAIYDDGMEEDMPVSTEESD